jgi:hypothetical protein
VILCASSIEFDQNRSDARRKMNKLICGSRNLPKHASVLVCNLNHEGSWTRDCDSLQYTQIHVKIYNTKPNTNCIFFACCGKKSRTQCIGNRNQLNIWTEMRSISHTSLLRMSFIDYNCSVCSGYLSYSGVLGLNVSSLTGCLDWQLSGLSLVPTDKR